MDTAVKKFDVSKMFNVFKGVSYAHQGWSKIQEKNVILWNIISISNIGFLF